MEPKRLVRILVLTVIIAALLYFLPKGPVQVDSGNRILMGTVARVIAVAIHRDIAQRGIDKAFAELSRIEELASTHLEDSEISKINRLAFSQPVKVSDTTFEILQTAVDYGRLTSGAFDISVGPLVELWQRAAEANQTPPNEELQNAFGKIGFDKIRLDPENKTVRLGVEGMKLDLGGIAKGYAVDQAVAALKDAGAVGGMVDVGGNIRCFGTPADGKKHWLIGLQDPNLSGKDQVLFVLELGDAAVATSGDYRRFVVVQNRRHSHIIDPRTGQSATGLSSASVITEKAVDADALATAVNVLGAEEGLKLIESLDNTEAIVVSPAPDYRITITAGAENYITKSRVKPQIYAGR